MSKKILLTGASGGFGFLTAKILTEQGHSVIGTMRSTSGKNEEVAKELSSLGVHLVEMDVTNEESVNSGVEQAISTMEGLDIVINNAGVGVSGMTEHFTPEDMQRVFDVNVFGVQRVMRAVLPFLREQGKGTIIQISSCIGRITLPFYGPYIASKWALEALSENYRSELSGFGIESCIVEPGGFPTTFIDNLIQPSDSSRNESYGEFMNAPQAMGEAFMEALQNNEMQRPQIVADAISSLIDLPFGEKPFRTVVDHMGMGEPVEQYNQVLHQITEGVYSAFGIEGMLTLNK